jgi:hypothetical protein
MEKSLQNRWPLPPPAPVGREPEGKYNIIQEHSPSEDALFRENIWRTQIFCLLLQPKQLEL